MLLGGWAFKRELGHEGRALMNRIRALRQGNSKSALTLSLPIEDTYNKKMAVCNWKEGPHQ